jgi:hypothetical protein
MLLTTGRRHFRSGPKPLIGSSVHSLGLSRKRLKQVGAAAQSHPDLPRLVQATIRRRHLLACIGQAIAPATGK